MEQGGLDRFAERLIGEPFDSLRSLKALSEVEGHFGCISGYVRMRVPEADCEDVVAEIFLRAVERRGEVRRDPAAWLFALARSQVAQYYRERRRNVARPEERRESAAFRQAQGPERGRRAEGAAGRGLSPLERLEHAEFRALLLGKLELLPELEREVIACKFTDGLSNIQIAGRLGITPNHLGVMLHRALGRLRQAMIEEAPHVLP